MLISDYMPTECQLMAPKRQSSLSCQSLSRCKQLTLLGRFTHVLLFCPHDNHEALSVQ